MTTGKRQNTGRKLIRGERYDVSWIDTYNFIGWHYEEDIDGKTLDKEFQHTLGFYIKDVGEWHILAMHKNPNTELGFSEWGNISYIPKKCVLNIQKL